MVQMLMCLEDETISRNFCVTPLCLSSLCSDGRKPSVTRLNDLLQVSLDNKLLELSVCFCQTESAVYIWTSPPSTLLPLPPVTPSSAGGCRIKRQEVRVLIGSEARGCDSAVCRFHPINRLLGCGSKA